MDMKCLEAVNLKHTDKASINYAKARCAIEQAIQAELTEVNKISASNAARGKRLAAKLMEEVANAKNIVINDLKGVIKPCKKFGKKVEFLDNTTARY